MVWDVDWATRVVVCSRPGSHGAAGLASVGRAPCAPVIAPHVYAVRMRQAGFDDVRGDRTRCFASGAFDPETYGVAIIPLINDFVAGRPSVSADEPGASATEQRDPWRPRRVLLHLHPVLLRGNQVRLTGRAGCPSGSRSTMQGPADRSCTPRCSAPRGRRGASPTLQTQWPGQGPATPGGRDRPRVRAQRSGLGGYLAVVTPLVAARELGQKPTTRQGYVSGG